MVIGLPSQAKANMSSIYSKEPRDKDKFQN